MSVSICNYLYLDDWRAVNSCKPWWYVYWNDRPGGSISFEGERYEIDSESILLLPPNTLINRYLENPVNHFYIQAKTSYPFHDVTPHVKRIPVDSVMKNLIKGLADEISEEGHCGFNSTSSASIYSLAYYAVSQVSPEYQKSRVADSRIEDTLFYIEKNYLEEINNSTLADRINMSRNAFLRLFRIQTNSTPKNYILNKRLDHAGELLVSSNFSIEEVAEKCQFANRHYFTRIFKKYKRMTPPQFRKAHWNYLKV